MINPEVLQAQKEIIRGYYTRIGMRPETTVEDIMQWLESDLQTLAMDDVMLGVEDILKKGKANE